MGVQHSLSEIDPLQGIYVPCVTFLQGSEKSKASGVDVWKLSLSSKSKLKMKSQVESKEK